MAKTTKPPKLTREQIKAGLETVPLDTILLGTATESRLTPKQREFARNLALGNSKAAAYREAYKSKGNSKTQANHGYRLSKSEDIQAIKAAYEVAIEAAKQRTPAQLRELVIHKLTEIAINGEKEANQIAALRLLGNVSEVAAFTERRETTTIRRSEDVRADLMAKLRGLTITAEDAEIVPEAESADSLLSEIRAGHEANEQENSGQPDAQGDPAASDPTQPPPPPEAFTTLSVDLHNVPHSQPLKNSNLHSEASPQSVSAEIIGLDVDVSSHIVEAELIVAEKEPGEDPTPLYTEETPGNET